GTGTATATDETGSYSISVPPGSTLVVSYIGLATLERPVTGSGVMDFELSENASGTLDDVVVVGYGQQRRNNLTGSIATVNNKALTQAPVADLSNAMIGRVPGIVTKQGSGEPGRDNANIFIRGVSTFSGGTEPLF